MIDKRYWYPFLNGSRDRSIKYLMQKERWTKERATKEYDEYRRKIMESDSFYLECENAPKDKKIEQRVEFPKIRLRATDEEIRDMYLGGMNYIEIASETGLDNVRIKQILDLFNVPRRRKSGSICDDVRDRIVKLLSEDYPVTIISQRLSIKRGVLSSYISRNNLREEARKLNEL